MNLKVVANEKQGGSGRWQMLDIGLDDRGDICPFLFLFGLHLEIILLPFPLTPAQYIIRAGVANMHDNPPYKAPLVLELLTKLTNTLVLQTQRKSGKCDY